MHNHLILKFTIYISESRGPVYIFLVLAKASKAGVARSGLCSRQVNPLHMDADGL